MSCVLLQVFVWIGNEAQEEEKTRAVTSGETDRRLKWALPGRVSDVLCSELV